MAGYDKESETVTLDAMVLNSSGIVKLVSWLTQVQYAMRCAETKANGGIRWEFQRGHADAPMARRMHGKTKMADLVRLMTEIRGQANDLEYSRSRADEADKEVDRLRILITELEGTADIRASELRRRDTQVVDLQAKLKVKEARDSDHMETAVSLGLSRAKVEELEAELKRLKPEPDPEVDEWLIFQPKPMYPYEYWWKSPGAGYAGTRVEAHRYTKVEATEIVNERMSLDLRLVHVSMDTPTVD